MTWRTWKYWVPLLLILLGGCQQEEPVADSGQPVGQVTATPAYRSFFGEPPTVASGTCFALVGYLPVPGEALHVRPFPLFMIGEERRMEALVEQLLRWDTGPEGGVAWQNPFPAGSTLMGITREDADLVRVELSDAAWDSTDARDREGMVQALGHALVQFSDVDRVMVVAGGRLLPGQAERGFFPEPGAVVEPGPPRLLTLVGIWEPGKEDPEELSAYFDRPLEITEFRLLHQGREVAGEYYRSVFDMAVVVHPAEPQSFREGMPLVVAWNAEDRLGRRSRGEESLRLVRLEHR